MLKTFPLARAAASVGAGFGVENPKPQEGEPSMFRIGEYDELRRRVGVEEFIFDQCRYGARSAKPTLIAIHEPTVPSPSTASVPPTQPAGT